MPLQTAIVGVHLLFEQSGQVLLQLRAPSAPFAPHTWHVPAGHREKESSVACAVRESTEELGVSVDPQDLRLVHVLDHYDAGSAAPRMQLFFRVLAYRGTPKVCEPDRHTRVAWYPYASLPSPLVDYTAVALTAIAAGRPYTDMGWGA
ncbi:NUDIX domain-containing protein [Streptomyces sp. TLI_146]|uniref:NUDIX hydrolase n=1 Tax=Streptomyces sp. TLI_146 TaxID=1938858 RepID=UPI000C710E96|nr:NUDIX domain-containing protein [Streptomyces sp. TLI_146]PKV82965.1 ADP-ribose pyrophosphatase YjhB (NUDIX family) [Streptomyces sp. TLI_146]